MDQPAMLRVAPSRIFLTLRYDWRFGWELKVTATADERHDPSVEVYGPLSSDELADMVGRVVEAAVASRLTLS